jgi:ectoine hydroxylase-related dioxygenase (phytanoyl-CoA dioxygenase family)
MTDSIGSANALHAAAAGRSGAIRRPAITARWVRNATVANRIAFEQEMKRERRMGVDSRLKRFVKQVSARQA